MRMCCGAGCGRAIANDARWCVQCTNERKHPQDDSKQHTAVRDDGAYDAILDKLNKGTRWQTVRARVVRKQPMCAMCHVAYTEIVDHIVPAGIAVAQALASGLWPCDRVAGYYLIINLQGVCRACHGLKTAEDKKHMGEWPSVVDAFKAAPKKVFSF